MTFYDSLLTVRNYPEPQRETMLEAIEGKLDRAMYLGRKTLQRQPFEVDMIAKAPVGEVKLRFYFEYSPDEQQLALRLLTARVGGLKVAAAVVRNNLPSFKKVVAQLTREKRLTAARRVFNKAMRRTDGSTDKGKRI
jgi:hypothetical protein